MSNVQTNRLRLAKLGVTPSWYEERPGARTTSGRKSYGRKGYLTSGELKDLAGRLENAAARLSECKWGNSAPERPNSFAAAFWAAPPTKEGFPKTSTLPSYFQAGLWSAVTKASLKVELRTIRSQS